MMQFSAALAGVVSGFVLILLGGAKPDSIPLGSGPSLSRERISVRIIAGITMVAAGFAVLISPLI